MSLQRGINLRSLAEKMGQCSGAEVRGICTEAGMYALRERRQHVTQEDFEFAIAKVRRLIFLSKLRADTSAPTIGVEEESGRKHVYQQVVLIVKPVVYLYFTSFPPLVKGQEALESSRNFESPLSNIVEDLAHVAITIALERARHTLPHFFTTPLHNGTSLSNSISHRDLPERRLHSRPCGQVLPELPADLSRH